MGGVEIKKIALGVVRGGVGEGSGVNSTIMLKVDLSKQFEQF